MGTGGWAAAAVVSADAGAGMVAGLMVAALPVMAMGSPRSRLRAILLFTWRRAASWRRTRSTRARAPPALFRSSIWPLSVFSSWRMACIWFQVSAWLG